MKMVKISVSLVLFKYVYFSFIARDQHVKWYFAALDMNGLDSVEAKSNH